MCNAGIQAKKGFQVSGAVVREKATPAVGGLKTVSGAHKSGFQGHPCP